jgi:hypothetical protein
MALFMVPRMPLPARKLRALRLRSGPSLVVLTLLLEAGSGLPVMSRAADSRPANPKTLALGVAAGTVVHSSAAGALGWLDAGRNFALWGDWPAPPVTAEPPDPDSLPALRDLTGWPDAKKNPAEFRTWNEILALAAQTSPAAFANTLRQQGEITWAQVLGHPLRHRGMVIRVQGRLQRLLRHEPPPALKEQGIRQLYEGQVQVDGLGLSPVMVLCTELPPALKPADNLAAAVSLDGYFLKRFLDRRSDGARVMPLVVGGVLRLDNPARPRPVDRAPAIDGLVAVVHDGTRLPPPEKRPVESWAYLETIRLAARTPDDAFAASARPNNYLTFSHLHINPESYHGRVVPVTGQLERLFRTEAPAALRGSGIPHVYEGWVATGTRGANPFCVVFTELPENIKVGKDLDYPVAFAGYFFKKLRYTAAEDDRFTPLLIGRTIRLQSRQAARASQTRPAALKDTAGDRVKAPPIDEYLAGVRDHTRTATSRSNIDEFWGYCQIMHQIALTPARALANSGREGPQGNRKDLVRNPAEYRGRVIHIEGRLKRLRQFDAPSLLTSRGLQPHWAQAASTAGMLATPGGPGPLLAASLQFPGRTGLLTLYEGWVYVHPDDGEPWNVIFCDLPPELTVGEDVDYPVAFDGYFFKALKLRFGKKDLSVPQLLGKTIQMQTGGAADGGRGPAGPGLADAFSTGFVITLTALAAAVIALLVGLAWWFRHGDRRVRSRLASLQPPASFTSLGPGPLDGPLDPGEDTANPPTGGLPPRPDHPKTPGEQPFDWQEP